MLATKQPQLHSQLEPNPNNKQQAYSLQVNDIHLRFGTKLPPPKEPIINKVVDTENGLASQLVDVLISPIYASIYSYISTKVSPYNPI